MQVISLVKILALCSFISLYFTGEVIQNTKWRITGISKERYELQYACCPELYPGIRYSVVIKRRTSFYLTNLIIPMVVISSLTMMAFLLPAESGNYLSFRQCTADCVGNSMNTAVNPSSSKWPHFVCKGRYFAGVV